MKFCDAKESGSSRGARRRPGRAAAGRLDRAPLLAPAVALCVLLGLVAGLIAAGGCVPSVHRPLRVGTLVWPPYELFFVAREKGLIPPDVAELVEFRSPIDEVRAFENGGLDAILVTADFALRIAERTPRCRIVMVVDISNGGDAVLAHPEIASLDRLAGHTVGVEVSSLGLYLLRRAFETEKVDPKDVQIVSVDYPELVSAYESGRVDAVVVFEPDRSRLLAEGAVQLFDSSRIPGEIVDVMVVQEGLVETRGEDLRTLADGFFGARDLLERDPDAVLPIMAARERVDLETMRTSIAGVTIPDRSTNLRLLGGEDPGLGGTLKRLAATMERLDLLGRQVDPRPLLDDRVVRGGSR